MICYCSTLPCTVILTTFYLTLTLHFFLIPCFGVKVYISQASGIQIGNNNTMHLRSMESMSLSSQFSASSSNTKYKELLSKYGENFSHILHAFIYFLLFEIIAFHATHDMTQFGFQLGKYINIPHLKPCEVLHTRFTLNQRAG